VWVSESVAFQWRSALESLLFGFDRIRSLDREPGFSFYRPREGLGYTREKERMKKKKEKNREKESSMAVFLFFPRRRAPLVF